MRRGHRIAISAIAATALTAGGGAALVAGPHTQAAKAVGGHASATPAGSLAEFTRLQADVLINESRIDAMARAISLAQVRIQAQGRRQAALALRRAEAETADKSAGAHTVAAHAVHTPQPAGTAPVLAREPRQTTVDDTATPAGAPPQPAAAPPEPAAAPPQPAAAHTTPAPAYTTPAPDPTSSPPGDDDDDGAGGR